MNFYLISPCTWLILNSISYETSWNCCIEEVLSLVSLNWNSFLEKSEKVLMAKRLLNHMYKKIRSWSSRSNFSYFDWATNFFIFIIKAIFSAVCDARMYIVLTHMLERCASAFYFIFIVTEHLISFRYAMAHKYPGNKRTMTCGSIFFFCCWAINCNILPPTKLSYNLKSPQMQNHQVQQKWASSETPKTSYKFCQDNSHTA